MPGESSLVWVVALGAFSFVLLNAVWQSTPRGSQTPFWLFIGAYFATTFLGGVTIGLQGLNYFESMVRGINLSVLYDIGSAKYWCILFGPLIVPAACVLALNLGQRRAHASPRHAQPRPAPPRRVPTSRARTRVPRISILAFALIVALFGGYALNQLHQAGLLHSINLWQLEQGNYRTLMGHRSDMFTSLGTEYFIIAYSVVPTLCNFALYEAVKSRSLAWQIALVISLGLAAFLTLSTLQKAYLMIILLSLGLGLVTLRVIRLRSLAIFAAGSFVLLTLMQTYLIGQWQLQDTARHLIFRMAHAYPYYINLYPTHMPFEGIYLGLNLIGVGEPSQISPNVMHYIHLSLGADLAHAPAAAHVDAYAQGGVIYSFAMLTVIGVLLGKLGGLRLDRRGPIAFAFYIQVLVFAYYLTQASFVTSVIGSYGIAWSVPALAPIWCWQKFVSKYSRRSAARTKSAPRANALRIPRRQPVASVPRRESRETSAASELAGTAGI